MKGRFEQVIVIGCGKAAKEIVGIVADRETEFGYSVLFIEHEVNALMNFTSVCKARNINYERITDKKLLTDWLLAVDIPTMIVSAGNYYIFPKEVISKDNIEIINFHNALLPKLPGRNATTWAIYFGEKVSGATWHYVTPNVDDGTIIAQKEVMISADMKAWELSGEIVNAAIELFGKIFPRLMLEHIEGVMQHINGSRKIYYSYEIPNEGLCSIETAPEILYRLLRSMDYGKKNIFPPLKLRLKDGAEIVVKRYSKVPKAHCDEDYYKMDKEQGSIYLPLSDDHELKITQKI